MCSPFYKDPHCVAVPKKRKWRSISILLKSMSTFLGIPKRKYRYRLPSLFCRTIFSLRSIDVDMKVIQLVISTLYLKAGSKYLPLYYKKPHSWLYLHSTCIWTKISISKRSLRVFILGIENSSKYWLNILFCEVHPLTLFSNTVYCFMACLFLRIAIPVNPSFNWCQMLHSIFSIDTHCWNVKRTSSSYYLSSSALTTIHW